MLSKCPGERRKRKKNNNNMDTETETVYSAVHVSSCDAVLFATRNFREKNDKEKKKKTHSLSVKGHATQEKQLFKVFIGWYNVCFRFFCFFLSRGKGRVASHTHFPQLS